MRNQIYFLTAIFILLNLAAIHAQSTITINAECGKAIEGEFTVQGESQDVKIRLGAGDVLEINVVPVGKYLKVRAEIFDPAMAVILPYEQGMFRSDKKSLVVKTDVLSASGLYTVRLSNWYSSDTSNVGSYTIFVTCHKKGG